MIHLWSPLLRIWCAALSLGTCLLVIIKETDYFFCSTITSVRIATDFTKIMCAWICDF